jgi:histidine phosphotransferase ChpT
METSVTLQESPRPAMHDLRTELATLIASRICHDLISPVGAISNGLELMSLSGDMAAGPELQLITESCDNANARIRFFRVAYGAASETAMISAAEIRGILAALTRDSRLTVTWSGAGDVPRDQVQLAFLALQCLESALRRGGTVTIDAQDGVLTLRAVAERIACDPALWDRLQGAGMPGGVLGAGAGVAAAHVQFALLPLLAADRGRKLQVTQGETELTIRV